VKPKKPKKPKTPVPAVRTLPGSTTYASRQIQRSQNKRAAALLFTPATPRSKQAHSAHGSPTPLAQSSHNLSPLRYRHNAEDISITSDPEANSGSDSDSEENIRSGIQSLNLRPDRGSSKQICDH